MRMLMRQVASIALWLSSAALAATPTAPAAAPTDLEAQSRAFERASQAVVGVQTRGGFEEGTPHGLVRT